MLVDAVLYVNTTTNSIRASTTGTAYPDVAVRLRNHLKLTVYFFASGGDPALISGVSFRVALKDINEPTGSVLALLTAATATGDDYYEFEWDSVDSAALRTLMGDSPSIGAVLEIEWTVGDVVERANMPVVIGNAWIATTDSAPDPTADASWEWLKLRAPEANGFTHDDTDKTLAVTGGSGTGDVVGPASATNGAFALFNGTTGKLLQSGGTPGGAALLNVGTTSGTVAAGDDSRLSDARTPTAHASSHTDGTDDIQNATASQKGLATAAQITKLDGIEANADVTDAANVGSVIDSASAVTSLGDTDKLPLTQSGTLKSIAYSALKTLLNALYQPISSVLSTYAGISPSSAIQSFLGSADSDAIQAQLGLGPLIDITGATTLEVGKRYLVRPTSSYTLTLPNSGVVPMMTYIDLVRSTDAWSAAPLTIDANGGTIETYSGGAQASIDLYSPGWSPEPYAVYRLTCVSLEIIGTFPSMTTIYHWQASIVNAVPMSAATQAALRAGVGQSGGLAAYTATPTAYSLVSATTTVNVSSATAPTSGQVLTATSGTAATWQTPSGGGSGAMVFLGEFTATAASQLNIDNVFDNALYDHYVMSGHVTPATHNVNLLIGLRSSVPADSTEIYSQGYLLGRLDTSGSASGGAAAWVLFAAAANYRADIIRLVYRPADGTSYHRLAGDFAFTAINARYGYQTNGEFQGTTARAGLRFYFSAGNLTGTIRIWGVKKS